MTVNGAGHVFLVHGDLMRTAADCHVIPKDGDDFVSPWWVDGLELVPIGSPHQAGWMRVEARRVDDHHSIAASTAGSLVVLVDTVTGTYRDANEMAGRAVAAVRVAAQQLDEAAAPNGENQRRARPLVAMPMLGTGKGGQSTFRSAIAGVLIPALVSVVREVGLDVAIVVRDHSEFVALQSVRSRLSEKPSVDMWSELAAHEDLMIDADRLGHLAATGQLSLFLGSGASAPLGLPTWSELLETLAHEARIELADMPNAKADEHAYLAVGSEIQKRLGGREAAHERLGPVYERLFCRTRHALGHGLLAGLRCRHMATTNYDNCLELALDTVWPGEHGLEGYRVLTRRLAASDQPWLLKYHGDIKRPMTIVLSEEDYKELNDKGKPLHGMVQTLLLTSHLLFIGFGFQDPDFTTLAAEVESVRQRADDVTTAGVGAATTLVLDGRAPAPGDMIRRIVMGDGPDHRGAARLLEVFLDRVSFTAATSGAHSAAFLLDERYAEGAHEADTALAGLLRELKEKVAGDPSARESAAHRSVLQLLAALGDRQSREALQASGTGPKSHG